VEEKLKILKICNLFLFFGKKDLGSGIWNPESGSALR
jgi:hypothetical protein